MLYFILLILMILAPDLYIWYFLTRKAGRLWNISLFTPSLIIITILTASKVGHYQPALMKVFFIMLLCTSLPKLIFSVFSALGRVLSKITVRALNIGNFTGIICASITAASIIYGLSVGWKQLIQTNNTIESSQIPTSFDGYRIIQLSDFHLGSFSESPQTVSKIVTLVNNLHPDLIFFTGDLINADPSEMDPFMEILSALKAKDGIYSILGNHDYCTYRSYTSEDGAQQNLQNLKLRQKAIGWNLLLNEHHIIQRGNDSIAILGVENDGRPPFPALADLPKTMKNLPDSIYKILLSHDPSHWNRQVAGKTDIQLTLSGHTHALQLKIGGFSPAQWIYSEWGGYYVKHNQALFVSLGVGGTVPFRYGAWPEINILTLKKK